MSSSIVDDSNRIWLEQFDILVSENLTNLHFCNAWLASQLYISERKLYRLIKDYTGQSPNHYIRSLRLEKAYQLLISGEYNVVKEVAIQVGFKKTEYFVKIFKAKFNVTPVEVLRNNNN